MFLRIFIFVAVLALTQTGAHARRVALIIGQNAYSGGISASIGLPALDNPARDAGRMAKLLEKHGFEVIACDGKTPGCFDLNRARILAALKRLEQRAAGADLALVFFAGHGLASEEGNILAPVDAKLNCSTGAVTNGVVVESIIRATKPARHKLVILDACRDNPLGEVCPNLKGKKLSFTRIEAGAMRGFLLVTSTQFGQQALDGPPGIHSPFATALFASLEASPSVYFEQVFNEVARATYEAAQKQRGFLQIPGRVVGGEAPADCLAGKGCIGDARMAAMALENEQLASDAAGVRNLLMAEEQARGKPYNLQERQKRVAELGQTLASIGTSTDPLRQEARRLIDQGSLGAGQAKLDEALDADEKALAETERMAAERRKAAARNAHDLAVLVRGTDIVKAVTYLQRATRLDPSDLDTWDKYGRAALTAGRTNEARTAFEQGALKAQDSKSPRIRYWALLGLGDVLQAQGNLTEAMDNFRAAFEIGEREVKVDPDNPNWQRDLSAALDRIGEVLRELGHLPMALNSFRLSLAITERLAKTYSDNADVLRKLVVPHDRIGGMLRAQGNLPGALDSFRASFAIMERLAKSDPENADWQSDLGSSHIRIGDVLLAQGNSAEALQSYRAALAVRERLAKSDTGNAQWQNSLSIAHSKIGEVLNEQGNLAEALQSFRASLAIIARVATSDPGNPGWQYNVSWAHISIGDVLTTRGNLPAALDSYHASHEIIYRLVKLDPTNTSWQHLLSVSHARMGSVLQDQGKLAEALDGFRASNKIFDRLAEIEPSNSELQHDLAASHNKIGKVLLLQRNLSEAV